MPPRVEGVIKHQLSFALTGVPGLPCEFSLFRQATREWNSVELAACSHQPQALSRTGSDLLISVAVIVADNCLELLDLIIAMMRRSSTLSC